MSKEIIIRYSELTLKGKNRKDFANLLVLNLRKKLDREKLFYVLEKKYDYLLLKVKNNLNIYYEVISKIPGISWFSEVFKVKATKKNILNSLDELLKDYKEEKTFRISAKDKAKKEFSSSDELTKFTASHILKNTDLKVKLVNFDLEIFIKILETNEALIYINKIEGIKGLPAGTAGKGLVLLSGGIDSPVAAYESIARGLNVSFITFLTNVTANEKVLYKIKQLANKINEFNGVDGKLYLVNLTKIQSEIASVSKEEYRIILLRRIYLKFCEIIANKYKYKVFILGDSIGQVASQTIESMTVLSDVTKKMIIRPLITRYKEEIIMKAKKIGTLDISNLPGDDMCKLFAPKKPIIFPKLNKVLEQENLIDNLDKKLFNIFEEDMRVIQLDDEIKS